MLEAMSGKQHLTISLSLTTALSAAIILRTPCSSPLPHKENISSDICRIKIQKTSKINTQYFRADLCIKLTTQIKHNLFLIDSAR
jgi:hypothetical protein